MKVWKITWMDSDGNTRTRYRTSQHESLKRLTRLRKEGLSGVIELVTIPTSRFELLDFINGQMALAEGSTDG
jgi:hypothetical protein